MTVAFGGIIITYVYPKKIALQKIDYSVKGYKLQIFDILFHQLPFLLFLTQYDTKIKPDNLVFFLITILLYILCVNPIKVYSMNYDCKKDSKKNNIKNSHKNINNCKKNYYIGIVLIVLYSLILITHIIRTTLNN